MNNDYKDQIKQIVLDEEQFVRLTMKGQIREPLLPWRQVIVRPVHLRNERYLQFSYFTQKQDITKNYRNGEAEAKLDELLALPFHSIAAQSLSETLHVQFTKKGKPIAHRTATNDAVTRTPDLSHDQRKNLLLPADRPDAFLQATGIMDAQGKVRPTMQAKFTQINEFLKLLEHTDELQRFETTPVQILDCGCGSAYLAFAVYHYLNEVRHIPAHLVGIDVNEVLIQKDNRQSAQLGFSEACFQKSAIIDYAPETPPDIVLALHACDTATDEAILQGILAESRLILAAPCCHHHLHEQLHAVAPFAPVFQDGILKKRLADILTDTFRALILRIMGYKTDVVEFIAAEHTDKNLMIRAVRRLPPGNPEYVQEYLALKNYWGVTPYLETLLGERFAQVLR
ncbi:MAG TPA: SAM-dependent methyltransferase, partial [Ktedonobacteraceae bacterium]|nr:SAM-dependent methyltransferase [Ktedonobacteraceae bacterium]